MTWKSAILPASAVFYRSPNCVVLPCGQGRGLGYSLSLLCLTASPTTPCSTVPHQLFWLPTCVQHRLGLQKCPHGHCPVWWEGFTSAGQSDQHLCPQPSSSKVGHCPEYRQATQKEAAKLPVDVKIKFLALLWAPLLCIISDTSLSGEAHAQGPHTDLQVAVRLWYFWLFQRSALL